MNLQELFRPERICFENVHVGCCFGLVIITVLCTQKISWFRCQYQK